MIDLKVEAIHKFCNKFEIDFNEKNIKDEWYVESKFTEVLFKMLKMLKADKFYRNIFNMIQTIKRFGPRIYLKSSGYVYVEEEILEALLIEINSKNIPIPLEDLENIIEKYKRNRYV